MAMIMTVLYLLAFIAVYIWELRWDMFFKPTNLIFMEVITPPNAKLTSSLTLNNFCVEKDGCLACIGEIATVVADCIAGGWTEAGVVNCVTEALGAGEFSVPILVYKFWRAVPSLLKLL
jgi:hypothetical protein